MDPDRLVCAACSGRVSQGRCPTCRAALRDLRSPDGPQLPATAVLWLAAALALLLLVLVALQH